jgi:hypothetical protein
MNILLIIVVFILFTVVWELTIARWAMRELGKDTAEQFKDLKDNESKEEK